MNTKQENKEELSLVVNRVPEQHRPAESELSLLSSGLGPAGIMLSAFALFGSGAMKALLCTALTGVADRCSFHVGEKPKVERFSASGNAFGIT